MQITVYKNFSKENNSTKVPTGGDNVNCVLKLPTSRLNPIFILESTDTTINFIKWDDRYYFVDDYNHVTNNVTEYVCHVDPMASWKVNIGASSQYVVRSQSTSDEYIIDMSYPTTAKITRTNFGFSGLSSIETTGTYIIGVINGESTTSSAGTVVYYAMSTGSFRSLMGKMFDDSLYSIDKELINPFQYIASCNWFPLSMPDGSWSNVKFGFWDSNIQGKIVSNSNRYFTLNGTATITEHPLAATRGKYLNAAPFRRATVSMYGFGQIPIDTMYLMDNQQVFAVVKADWYSGMGTLIISTASGYEISRTQTQFSVPVQVSQLNTNYVGTAQQVLSVSAGLTPSVGGIIGYANGIISATQSMIPTVSTQGTNGDATVYTLTPSVMVDIMDVVDDAPSRLGKPLCKFRTISSLSGYIQCEKVDIEIPATQTEKDIIVSYMESGFYYE